MSALQKAQMQAIFPSGQQQSEPFEVQFNPASLRLQLNTSQQGGRTVGNQARQRLGTSSMVVSFELVFDTSDEGTDTGPHSVREKTKLVEQFVLPKGTGTNQKPPPKARFVWGDLRTEGVMESLSIDFEHFSPEGLPLRARLGVSISCQDPRYELPEKKTMGPAPGATAGAPGTQGTGGDQTAPALAGESGAEFAARLGLDPAAWRGLASVSGAFEGTLSLEAGAEIGFSADLSASAGLGVHVGIEAGVDVSLDASFGLTAGAELAAGVAADASLGLGVEVGGSVGAGLGVSADTSAGFALSAAGGVSAATATVQSTRAAAAASQARASFGAQTTTSASQASTSGSRGSAASGQSGAPLLPAAPSALAIGNAPARTPDPVVKPSRPDQTRGPLRGQRDGRRSVAEPAPLPPSVDPRAVTYGYGVPLRSRAAMSAEPYGSQGDFVPLRPRPEQPAATSSADPTAAPWTYLPAEQPGVSRPANGGASRTWGCRCGERQPRRQGTICGCHKRRAD